MAAVIDASIQNTNRTAPNYASHHRQPRAYLHVIFCEFLGWPPHRSGWLAGLAQLRDRSSMTEPVTDEP